MTPGWTSPPSCARHLAAGPLATASHILRDAALLAFGGCTTSAALTDAAGST